MDESVGVLGKALEQAVEKKDHFAVYGLVGKIVGSCKYAGQMTGGDQRKAKEAAKEITRISELAAEKSNTTFHTKPKISNAPSLDSDPVAVLIELGLLDGLSQLLLLRKKEREAVEMGVRLMQRWDSENLVQRLRLVFSQDPDYCDGWVESLYVAASHAVAMAFVQAGQKRRGVEEFEKLLACETMKTAPQMKRVATLCNCASVCTELGDEYLDRAETLWTEVTKLVASGVLNEGSASLREVEQVLTSFGNFRCTTEETWTMKEVLFRQLLQSRQSSFRSPHFQIALARHQLGEALLVRALKLEEKGGGTDEVGAMEREGLKLLREAVTEACLVERTPTIVDWMASVLAYLLKIRDYKQAVADGHRYLRWIEKNDLLSLHNAIVVRKLTMRAEENIQEADGTPRPHCSA
uniref:Uncharacterized protein n=1 Tax=Chromera velia CCMP2878 TaxID=1169474 RepID=A0A0G4HF64_9ALVE|eukprot:Cvel_26823.t1-p1 / transcript=Cvel_26823.t1 / gene=Cvel_26823 / organism=Chromera_velia_CCMP2878 / gene_product=hypothetical protein / transcript_product=hypothetical protein / location=Cvel_scaffold3249:11365-12588(-) / protein_length=408 / sequence_SO=supercontig / SO=protein_coding / is_pseudo=false